MVTTVTSAALCAAAANGAGPAAGVDLAAIFLLIALLIARELTYWAVPDEVFCPAAGGSAWPGKGEDGAIPPLNRAGRVMDAGIVPLLYVFVFVVAHRAILYFFTG